jgi:hypothetical protein
MNELEYITDIIDGKIKDLSDYIVGGNCNSMESYSNATGQLRAYEDVKTEINDLQKKINEL